MGYTHYWKTENTTKEDQKGFKNARPLFEKILDKYKDIVQYESDEDLPAYCEDGVIRFNGIEDDGHETFYFSINQASSFEFCKTARKPYDAPVCEILVVIMLFCPNVEVTSDGFDRNENGTYAKINQEWINAINTVGKYVN